MICEAYSALDCQMDELTYMHVQGRQLSVDGELRGRDLFLQFFKQVSVQSGLRVTPAIVQPVVKNVVSKIL